MMRFLKRLAGAFDRLGDMNDVFSEPVKSRWEPPLVIGRIPQRKV